MITVLTLALLAQASGELSPEVAARRLQRIEQRASQPRFDVKFTRDADGVRMTLESVNASFQSIVKHIGRELGLEVVGLDVLQREPAVFARLEERPLEDGLAWVAGSVGFYVRVGGTKIEVLEELPVYPSRADLYERAKTSLWRAVLDHPKSEQAPRAAFIRASIEAETSGRDLESARLFDGLIEDYPDCDLVPEAYLEAGKHYGLAGMWSDAIDRFDDLAGYRTPHPFGVEARRRLSDAHTRLAELAKNPGVQRENAYKALLVLDALDDNAPAQTPQERRERLIIRARASSLNDDPMLALRSIDLAASYSDLGDRDPELMDLRATALDRAGQHQDAFLAWLQAAEIVEGDVRADRYRRAAASANACGSHLAAIATWKTAENQGLGRAVADEYNRALMSLGLEPEVSTVMGDRDKIAQGERQFDSRRYKECVDTLRPVFDRRFGLERDERQRLAITYSRALEREKRLDEAIHVLRTSAQEAERVADRRALYQTASSLYERNDDIERAIAALNGSL